MRPVFKELRCQLARHVPLPLPSNAMPSGWGAWSGRLMNLSQSDVNACPGLYVRRDDEVSLDEVEWILIWTAAGQVPSAALIRSSGLRR